MSANCPSGCPISGRSITPRAWPPCSTLHCKPNRGWGSDSAHGRLPAPTCLCLTELQSVRVRHTSDTPKLRLEKNPPRVLEELPFPVDESDLYLPFWKEWPSRASRATRQG